MALGLDVHDMARRVWAALQPGSQAIPRSALQDAGIPTIDYVDFNTLTEDPPYRAGRTYLKDNVLNTMTGFPNVTTQNGEELQQPIVNKEGTLVVNGTPVSVEGALGQRLTVEVPSATEAAALDVIGLLTHDVENNANGRATTFGLVRDVDTAAFTPPEKLYLNGATLTNVRPTAAGTYAVQVGYCVSSHPTQGIIAVFVRIEGKLADTTANRPTLPRVGETFFDTTLGKMIVWSGTTWINVDGSAL